MKSLLCFSILALSLSSSWSAFPPKYRVVDLSSSAVEIFQLNGLNEDGEITAFGSLNGNIYGLVYSAGRFSPIGGGQSPFLGAINNVGQITGAIETFASEFGRYKTSAFVFSPPQSYFWIGTLGGLSVFPRGINDDGTVVGESDISPAADSPRHAFSFIFGLLTVLGTLLGGQSSAAFAINNSGVIVGSADTDRGAAAFIYSNGEMKEFVPSADSPYVTARAINDAGQITGSAVFQGGFTHAYLGTPEHPASDLGALSPGEVSQGFSLNEDGDVVGNSGSRAFLYTDGQMFDLNDLVPPHQFGTLVYQDSSTPMGRLINRRGQILVTGFQTGSPGKPLLLEPLPPTPGRYTLIIGPPANQAVLRGYGWATVTLRANGKIFLHGRLGNNTPLHAEGKLLPDGTFHIAQTQGGSKPDAFSAPIRFKSKRASDFSGTAMWTHNADAHDPVDTLGFSTEVAVQGMQLQTPAFAEGRYSLSFAADGFPAPHFVTFRYSRKSGITELSNRGAKIRFNARTGVFRGAITFMNDAYPYSFSGVIDQTAKVGKGLYQFRSFTGAATLKKLR